MEAKDLLAPGEEILIFDGRTSFTDRRVITVIRSSFEETPYEHISSVRFRTSIPLLPLILGVVVLIVGLFIWNSEPQIMTYLNIDPNLWLTLVIIFSIVLFGISVLLTRRDLTLMLDSGKNVYLRLRDRHTAAAFLVARGSVLEESNYMKK